MVTVNYILICEFNYARVRLWPGVVLVGQELNGCYRGKQLFKNHRSSAGVDPKGIEGQVFRDRITTFHFSRKRYVIWKDPTLRTLVMDDLVSYHITPI